MKLSDLPVINRGKLLFINGKKMYFCEAEERYSYLRDPSSGAEDRKHRLLYTFKDSLGREVYFHSDEDLEIGLPSEKEDPRWLLALKLLGITAFACVAVKIIVVLVHWGN